MSELINCNKPGAQFHRQLLATVSSLALAAITAQGAAAQDQDDNHPTVWIELGAQLERIDTAQSPFAPPFATAQPNSDLYKAVPPIGSQRPPRYAIGGEGKITFTPEHSDWVFSAGVRYGRAISKRSLQHQTVVSTPFPSFKYVLNPAAYPTPTVTATAIKLAFAQTRNQETHAVLDFQAGKDVGLGLFGSGSVVSAGVRYAAFNSKSDARITARPTVTISKTPFILTNAYVPLTKHTDYFLLGHAERSFRGIGPSLSWTGSAPFVGNPREGEISFDWGLNGALLFGRQKASGVHETSKAFESFSYFQGVVPHVHPQYHHTTPFSRSRSVVVSNVGVLAGLSFRYSDAKVSFGYRADYFFGAMDVGIDARKTTAIGFQGPFAKLSVGLGG